MQKNLLRVVLCGRRCSPYLRTAALLGHKSLPLATIFPGIQKCCGRRNQL